MSRHTGPSAAVLEVVRARLEDSCLRCGGRATETHHRVGRGAGGTRRLDVNSPSALARLCHPCHQYVTEHPTEGFATGWAVRRSDPRPPSTIPLVDVYGAELHLTDSGDVRYTAPAGFYPSDPADHLPPF